MGFILSKIFDFFSRSRNNFRILLLGVQNAGKTTILYRLSLGQFVKTNSTIGSNVEEISYNNVKFQAWDLGGQESYRSIWEEYYTNTDGIIYVIDTKEENCDDSKKQFYKMLQNDKLKGAVILIFANKQDLPGAKTVAEIMQIYELDKIKSHSWHIQPCSAHTGEGLITGIKWLSDNLVFKSNNTFPINPYIDYSKNEVQDVNKTEERVIIKNEIKTEVKNENKNEISINNDINKDIKNEMVINKKEDNNNENEKNKNNNNNYEEKIDKE